MHYNLTKERRDIIPIVKYFKVVLGDEYGIDETFILTAQTLQGVKMLAQKRCKEGQRVWFVYEQDDGKSIFSKDQNI